MSDDTDFVGGNINVVKSNIQSTLLVFIHKISVMLYVDIHTVFKSQLFLVFVNMIYCLF